MSAGLCTLIFLCSWKEEHQHQETRCGREQALRVYVLYECERSQKTHDCNSRPAAGRLPAHQQPEIRLFSTKFVNLCNTRILEEELSALQDRCSVGEGKCICGRKTEEWKLRVFGKAGTTPLQLRLPTSAEHGTNDSDIGFIPICMLPSHMELR